MINTLKKTRFIRLLGAALLSVGIGACNNPSPQGINLLWVHPMKDHPVHRLMQAGFLNRCKELGYHCEVVGNPSATAADVSATIPLAEAALSRTRFDGVAVYGIYAAIHPYISKLSQEGLPVVVWHVLPEEGSVPGLKAAVAHDIAEAGANAAIAMGEKLGGQGSVAVTLGSSNETENAMASAFRSTMAERYPDIKVLADQIEGYEPSAAEAKAIAILQGNPDVVGAFSTTGNGNQTWAGAARKTGRNVIDIGMDYIRQNLDLIKSGQSYGLVAQPLYEESAKVAELLGALAQGETVPYRNVLPSRVITADDLDPYYQILESAGH